MQMPPGLTVAEVWDTLEGYQKARLHLAALEKQGKRPSPLALADIAEVSVECAKRQLRWRHRQRVTRDP